MSRINTNIAFTTVFIILCALIAYLLLLQVGWGVFYSTMIAGVYGIGSFLLMVVGNGIQHYRHKSAFEAKQKQAGDTSVEQSRIIEIDLPMELAFDLAIEALKTLDDEPIPQPQNFIRSQQILKIHKLDREMGQIKAGLRAKTIGIQDVIDFSHIDIQLQRLDANTTRLRIDSQPANRFEGYDLGRHMHYVNQLALYLRQTSHEQSANVRLIDADDSHDFVSDHDLSQQYGEK